MSFEAKALVILIASPGDTADERAAVSEALGQWNVARGKREGVVVIPWLYEQHSIPQLGDSAQSVINRQALDRADVVVAFFDSRLGTQTDEAVSGTAEEIEKALASGKPVHVYFSTEDVARSKVDPGQLQALNRFKTRLSRVGLLGSYDSPAHLANQVSHAIDYDVSTLVHVKPETTQELRGARWAIDPNGGDTYLVTNIGDARAYDVRISAFKDLSILQGPEPQDVDPDEALEIMALQYGAVEDNRVLVNWRDEADSVEERSWKHPLPPRPPRRR